MSAMPPLRDIINDTPADATDVEWNFNTIETHIRNELLDRSGTVSVEGPLPITSPPTNPTDAVNKAYADALIPVGVMHDWPVATLPTDMQAQWKIADGSILNVSEYPVLYDRYGSTFNRPGDAFGGTQFRLPDMRRRVAVGYDALTAPFDVIGFNELLGVADPVLPQHTHPQTQHTHAIDHDHGAVNTGNDAPEHTHGMVHTHPGYDHNSSHGFAVRNSNSGMNYPGSWGAETNSGVPGGFWERPPTGGADRSSTDGASARHIHGVDMPNFTGTSGQSAAVDTGQRGEATIANKNYPPFVIVNKIIKVK